MFLVQVLRNLLKRRLHGATGQPFAYEGTGLLVGGKVLKWRQVLNAPEPKRLKKTCGGSKERCLASILAHLTHVTFLSQRGDNTVGVYATNRSHALTGHGLMIGNHRQRLERGLR